MGYCREIHHIQPSIWSSEPSVVDDRKSGDFFRILRAVSCYADTGGGESQLMWIDKKSVPREKLSSVLDVYLELTGDQDANVRATATSSISAKQID